jgi:hypothetical protein
LNIRFNSQTGIMDWVDQVREGTQLSRADIIRLAIVHARETGWRPVGHGAPVSGGPGVSRPPGS